MSSQPDLATPYTVVSTRDLDAPRPVVFDAYVDPAKLTRWWGPAGFTMDVEEIDIREGGHWRFTFTAPDGRTFKNHQVFGAIDPPGRIVFEHQSGPHYLGTVILDDLGQRTRVTMYWTFEPDVFPKVRDAVVQGNEENLDRLWSVVRDSLS